MDVKVLNRKNLIDLLDMRDVIDGVKDVYKLKANNATSVWPHVIHHFDEPAGVMDIKSGFVGGEVMMHGAKMLNTFWGNEGTEVPIFNGLMMVFDSKTGAPRGMLDASYITSMRTGAAGAIGVETFARKDSKNLFILGAGRQASFQLAATLILMENIEKVFVYDALSYDNANKFANDMPGILVDQFNVTNRGDVNFVAVSNDQLGSKVNDTDIIITITPAREPVIKKEWVKKGTHFSCVGADMAGKQEIHPDNFFDARIYADDKKQTIAIGEMELAIKGGFITEDDVLGDIGMVLNGTLDGRVSDDDITIFAATGIALLDIVTAKLALDKGFAENIGTTIDL